MTVRNLSKEIPSQLAARRRNLPGRAQLEPLPLWLLGGLFLVGLYFVIRRFVGIFRSPDFERTFLQSVAVIAVAWIAGLVYARVLAWLDRNEREPWPLMVSTVILGAIAAFGLVGPVNQIIRSDMDKLLSQPPINDSEYAVLFGGGARKVLTLKCDDPRGAVDALQKKGVLDVVVRRMDHYLPDPSKDLIIYVVSRKMPGDPRTITDYLAREGIDCVLRKDPSPESSQDFFENTIWANIRERIWTGRDPARRDRELLKEQLEDEGRWIAVLQPTWQRIAPTRVAPLVEEAVKALILLLVLMALGTEFNGPLDGIVYGALIGLGFAVTENAAYMLERGLQEQFVNRIAIRGLTGHATYTAFTGLGLGILFASVARWRRGTRGPYDSLAWLAPILGFGLAVAAHAVWNNLNNSVVTALSPFWLDTALRVLVLQIPFVLVLALGLWFSWRREDAMIRAYLLPDLYAPDAFVGQGDMSRARDRFRARLRAYRSLGYAGWRLVGKLQRTLIEAAFYRGYAAEEGPDAESSTELEALWRRARELVEQVAR